MGTEQAERMRKGCPMCRITDVYRRSWLGREVRGIQRELLLTARGALDRWISCLQESCPPKAGPCAGDAPPKAEPGAGDARSKGVPG